MQAKKLFFCTITLSSVILFFLFFTGCNSNESLSDDSTKEAKTEKGLMALDDSDYSKAEKIFLDLMNGYPEDDKIKAYYSSSLAGLAGLDTFNLMETLDDLNDDSSREDTLEIVGRTITNQPGENDPVIQSEDIDKKISYFEKALDALIKISGTSYSELISNKNITSKKPQAAVFPETALAKLNDDEKVQLGLISIHHAVLVISDMVVENLSLTQITLTEAGIRNLYGSSADFSNIQTYISDNDLLEKLSLDIELIDYAVDSIVNLMGSPQEDNDIKDQFEEFKNLLDMNQDLDITMNELEAYIDTL